MPHPTLSNTGTSFAFVICKQLTSEFKLVCRDQVSLRVAPENSERVQNQFCMPAALSCTHLSRSDFSLSHNCCQLTSSLARPAKPLIQAPFGKGTLYILALLASNLRSILGPVSPGWHSHLKAFHRKSKKGLSRFFHQELSSPKVGQKYHENCK